MLAFLPTLGFGEMFVLIVIGLLLYGRNLPQAGRTMGRFVAQMKRGFQDFKDQMDRDESLREVRKTFEDTSREMRNITAMPRAIANPTQGLRDLAHGAMATNVHGAADEDVADEPAPPQALPQPAPQPGAAPPGAPAALPTPTSAAHPTATPPSGTAAEEPRP